MMKILCSLSILALVHLSSGALKTDNSKTGVLENSLTFTCELDISTTWYLMQWKLMDGNGEPIILASIGPSDDNYNENSYAASKGAHYDFRAIKGVNAISFELEFTNLVCDDAGMYQCAVIGNEVYTESINLTLRANPGKTHTLDMVSSIENRTIEVECKGNVGLPAYNLRWYKRGPSDARFNEIQEQPRQTVTKNEDCTYNATSILHIEVTRDLNGTYFMCVAEDAPYSYIIDKSSKIKFNVEVNTSTMASTTQSYEVICEGGVCDVEDKNPNSAGGYSLIYNLLISLMLTGLALSIRV